VKDYAHLIPSAATLDPAQMLARRTLAGLARSGVFIHSYYTKTDVQHTANRALWLNEWKRAYGKHINVMQPQMFNVL
jgi:hypothetical protein